MVTAEAMSCSCEVVATKNVGVHSDLISHAENGYLYEAGNISELRSTLKNQIEGRLPHLGAQARASVIANWSAEKEAKKLMEVYGNEIQ